MSAATAPVRNAGRSYIFEFSAVMALYVLAIIGRDWTVGHVSDPNLVLAARIAPILPIWLAFWAVVRHYRRIDEYGRLRMLKELSIAFGLTSCALISYSLLMDAGLPPLAITWAWPTLAASWGLTRAILSIADR